MVDLVSGTKIAVKSAPMIQSAAYNQKVPENLSGDCTCWQRSQRLNLQMKTLMTFAVWLEAKLIIYQGFICPFRTHQVYEGFGDNEAGNEGKANYNGVCH